MTDISKNELLQHIRQHYKVNEFVPDEELDKDITDKIEDINSYSRWSDGTLNWQKDLKEEFDRIDGMNDHELSSMVMFAVVWHELLGEPTRNEQMYRRLFLSLIEVAERALEKMFEVAGKMSRERMLMLVKFHYANGKFYHVNNVDSTMESFQKIMAGQRVD